MKAIQNCLQKIVIYKIYSLEKQKKWNIMTMKYIIT